MNLKYMSTWSMINRIYTSNHYVDTLDTSMGTSRKWSRKLAFCSGSSSSSRAAAGSPWRRLLPILSTCWVQHNIIYTHRPYSNNCLNSKGQFKKIMCIKAIMNIRKMLLCMTALTIFTNCVTALYLIVHSSTNKSNYRTSPPSPVFYVEMMQWCRHKSITPPPIPHLWGPAGSWTWFSSDTGSSCPAWPLHRSAGVPWFPTHRTFLQHWTCSTENYRTHYGACEKREPHCIFDIFTYCTSFFFLLPGYMFFFFYTMKGLGKLWTLKSNFLKFQYVHEANSNGVYTN